MTDTSLTPDETMGEIAQIAGAANDPALGASAAPGAVSGTNVEPDAVNAACYPGFDYRVQARAYTANLGINEWSIITIQGETNLGPCRAFQVWLNQQTGEIRYQYLAMNGESAYSKIGLRLEYGFVGSEPDTLVVSNNDLNGAVNNSGYRFTPAPPQPTKVHTVTVDALMTSIGFLQTGFSGNFEPLAVTDPAGAAISCADTANVLCLTVDNSPGDRSVQYVQVKVNGRTGVWSAAVDAGSARQATYSFSSMALSDLEVEGFHDRQAPSFKPSRLLVGLQNAADGNTLQAWLQKPNGQRWGSPFTLYDDGAHGDGQAGDGQFGLLDFQPPGRGVAWLWVQGALGGQSFQRMDPAPLSFQPVELTVLTPGVIPSDGSAFPVALRIESRDPSQRCYTPSFEAPPGWYVEWELGEGYPCLNNGESVER
ncbi:MAG: choice-of-anchor X domain-containing protein, partial [Caldilineaceae bacterium]